MTEELIEESLFEAEERMEKAVQHAKEEFAGVRSGRANSGLVEKLLVEYYGAPTPMQQLASFSVPEARLLVISPFDKSSIAGIEKAIRDANLGLNPSTDGSQVRLAFPALTEERRKEYVKLIKTRAEDGRGSIRGARRDSRKDLEKHQKAGEITEDDFHRACDDIDAMTKKYEATIDAAVETKTVELMES